MNAENQDIKPPTEAEKLHVANTFFTSLKNDDWDTLTSIIVADAAWTLPGTSLLSGIVIGPDGIIKRIKGLKGFGVNFQLKHILYGLHGFTLSLHNTASSNELILDQQVAIVFDISGGKITAMATYLSDVAGINRFFRAWDI